MLYIFKASAGSGKTYTLVREYLRLALKSDDAYKHILAITFTNKAAAEMKTRIMETLRKLSIGSNEVARLRQELSAATGKPETLLQQNAKAILQNMLHHYSDISICTIDSFVNRVVRAFAYDLHLPMNFDVEMDSKKIIGQAVELLLDGLEETDRQMTAAVLDFARSRMEEGKGWNVEHSIAALGGELFLDDAVPYLERLANISPAVLKQAQAALYARKKSIEQKLFAEGKSALALMEKHQLTAADFYGKGMGLYVFFKAYAKDTFPSNSKGNKYVKATMEDDNWGKSEAVPLDVRAQLSRHYRAILTIWEKEESDYFLCLLLLKNFDSFLLLSDLQRLMEDWKRERHLLHIGDFQRKVFEIVKEQEAPIVYERIGDWYNNILIDEFQDTSVMQWQNLLPLVENAQLKNEDSLVVGDGKQAIYRFRGGEVEQFAALPAVYGSDKSDLLKEREIAINNYGVKADVLQKNFRSRNEIIDFNNFLYHSFLQMPSFETHQAIYQDYFQEKGKDKPGGFVRIEFLEKSVAEEEAASPQCERVEEILREVLAKGYSYRDVAVLSYTNKMSGIIATHLISKNIQVVSSESLLIHRSPKVRLLLSLLTYLEARDNHLARLEILHFTHLLQNRPLKYEQFTLTGTAEEFEHELMQATGVVFEPAQLPVGHLVDLILCLVRDFRLSDEDPFVQFFLDETILYASRFGNYINEFLQWWDSVKDKKSIVYPETLDAVRLMTIHKAKGLQFPVVIVPDAAKSLKMSKDFFWTDLHKPWLPQLDLAILPVQQDILKTEFAPLYVKEDSLSFLDMVNAFYVATTRPEDALYLLSEEQKEEPEDTSSITGLLVEFLRRTGNWQGFRPYTFGDESFRKEKAEEKQSGVALYEQGAQGTPSSLSATLKVKLTPTLLWSESASAKIDHGKLLHEILKQVKYEGDEDKVIRKFSSAGWIDEGAEQQWLADVKNLITHPQMRSFFQRDCEVWNERPLLKKEEKTRIPDRVVIKNGKAVLIDYKTGNPLPRYAEQVNEYAERLREAGWEIDKKILFYTHNGQMEIIS